MFTLGKIKPDCCFSDFDFYASVSSGNSFDVHSSINATENALMKTFIKTLKSFAANQSGASAIEYALLAALIGSVIVTGATTLGGAIDTELAAVAANF